MNVADQFQKIGVFFTDDGFVSVLEEVAAASMAFIEGDGIAGHETAHDFAEWSGSCSYEKVKMVRDQCPGITLGLGLFENVCKPFEEGLSVLIISEDFSSFDPPGHYVLQDTGSIKSGLAWHDLSIKNICG